MKQYLFVVSGGPGSGKTTVLAELERFGFAYSPEVARQIIREQVASDGTALPWADRSAYTLLMLQRSIDAYRAHSDALSPTFFDRGIPDTLGYARLIGFPETGLIEEACREYRYAAMVFLAPPWQEIYVTDGERKQDFAEAERTFEVLRSAYAELGYQVLELPQAPPRARAKFILDCLGS